MQALENSVIQALNKVIDPATGIDVIRMRLIPDAKVDNEGNVKIIFRPSSPVCPMAYKLAYDIKRMIKDIKGVKSVKIKVEGFKDAKRLETMLEEV